MAARRREGSGRNSDADFGHFLEIAYGSLMEVVSQLFVALDENYINGSVLGLTKKGTGAPGGAKEPKAWEG